MTLKFDPIDEAARQWGERWDGVPPMHAVTSLMRVQQLVIARLDAILKPHGLTFARYELLMLLTFSRSGALPLGKIGARLQVHPASVTNAVDRLEAQGFVRRTPHPTDGRTTLAEITGRGRRVARAATEDMNALFRSLDLPEALFEVLRDVRAAAGDFTTVPADGRA